MAIPSNGAQAQCTVTSANGYTVHLSVYPQAIEPASLSCPGGYNYRVRMGYTITFSGSNIPSSLWTLQGRVTCGSTSIFFDLPNNGGSGSVLSSNDWTTMTNCATATPSSNGCNTVRIEIQGPGIASQEILCGFSPLPVELLTFTAEPVEQVVRLRWSTATEQDNDHFAVDRSADGDVYTELLKMPGAGNSQHEQVYAVADERPLAGVSYYRLRQVDTDGTTTLGPTVVVTRERERTLMVHPNPVRERFWLEGAEPGGSLEILTPAGEHISSGRLAGASVPVGFLAPGLYLVRYTDPVTFVQRTARFVRE
ncbi:MAG TPA: hypothetical protein PKE21_06975 [Flavobacteriales bacterium]|nr:hypothetical protein [Flavobacteriales bacterium]HMR27203.1 hypothetical protein [Flavobacteriales bacterium]